MRLAVTGGSGFLGAHLIRAALAEGHEIVVLARPGGDRRNLKGLKISVVDGLISSEPPHGFPGPVDALIHLAALYAEGEAQVEALFEINARGSGAVADACLRDGVPRMIHISTMGTCVPRPAGGVGSELDQVDPERASAYARSKLEGEAEVLRRSGLERVIVNPAAPVGAFDLGPSVTGRRILDVIHGRCPRLVNGPVAHLPASACARGILLALERGVDGERYLLGAENLEPGEFVDRVARAAGVRPPRPGIWERMKMRRRPRVSLAIDDSRARAHLGYAPGDLDAAIEEAVRWFRS